MQGIAAYISQDVHVYLIGVTLSRGMHLIGVHVTGVNLILRRAGYRRGSHT